MRSHFAWFGVVLSVAVMVIGVSTALREGRLKDDFPSVAGGLLFWSTILVRTWRKARPPIQQTDSPPANEYDSKSSSELIEEQATQMLRPHLSPGSWVSYCPNFPVNGGGTTSFFQLLLVVGPGEDETMRADVHKAFLPTLPIIGSLNVVRRADSVAIRVRRHIPPKSLPHHPHMFIECIWRGSDLAAMLRANAFADWHGYCRGYTNRFDKDDPLNIVRDWVERTATSECQTAESLPAFHPTTLLDSSPSESA